ncbi:MAG: hypothetical protein L0228_02120 [Planctomycetes bacterium]|nr:hypothetical protein [Planctomycetota bacterium]
MIANSMRRAIVAFAILAMLVIAVEANAACCGGGMTAFYPSAYNTYYAGSYSAYYPSAYQTYYSGWYPGYYWDRIRTRLWGSPSTYIAAYPSTYVAGYAPTYSVGYRPMYTAGYATSYAAPAGCASCASCPTCPSYTAAYPSCNGCSTCATQTVTQTSYQQPACPSCAVGAAQGQTTVTTPESPQTYESPTSTSTSSGPAPTIDPSQRVPEQREEQKPPVNGTPPEVQPGPGDDSTETQEYDPYKGNSSDSSTYFEAPKLHDPNDRTAQRAIRPVTTAVYTQPVSHRSISPRPVTAQQAQQDAIGWTSVSN